MNNKVNSHTEQNKEVLIISSRDHAFEGRLYHLVAKNLKKIGYNITILTYFKDDLPYEQAEKDGIQVITFKKHPNKYIRKIHTLRSLFKVAKKLKPDIIHATEVDAALFTAARLKKYFKSRYNKDVKLVFESPEVWTHFYAALFKNSLVRRFFIHFIIEYEHWMLKRYVDGVLTAHELEENYYIWQYPWIPVRTVLASPQIKDWGEPPVKNGPVTTIGNDGFFMLNRGMDIMLGAFEILAKEFDDLKFIAAGDIPTDKDKRFFDSWCDRTGLADRVIWPGWVDRAESLKYLDQMDIGIAALREDPHSNRIWPANKLMYYFSRGIPVVSTTRASFSRNKIKENDLGVVVDHFTAKDLADKIRELIKNPERTREMGQKAYKYALEHYDIDESIRQLIMLYDDIYDTKPYPLSSKITLRG